MKVFMKLFTLAFLVVLTGCTTGCSVSKEYTSQIHAEVLKCPEGTAPDEQCVIEYRGPTHLMGGGRVTSVFVSGGQCTYTDTNGRSVTMPCGTKNIATAVRGDRLDVLVPGALDAIGDIGSANQYRKGIEYAADKATDAVKYETDKALEATKYSVDNQQSSGGDIIFLNENTPISSAGAVSQQQLDADMTSGCSGSNCYDPTQ